MKLLFSLFITHFLLFGFLFGQKKIIDHNAYNSWKKTSNVQLSKNGNIVSFETTPHRGDGYLYIYQNEEIDSFFLGEKADISSDELFVAFSKTPGFDTLRKCELNEISKKKWPKNELNIYSIPF